MWRGEVPEPWLEELRTPAYCLLAALSQSSGSLSLSAAGCRDHWQGHHVDHNVNGFPWSCVVYNLHSHTLRPESCGVPAP